MAVSSEARTPLRVSIVETAPLPGVDEALVVGVSPSAAPPLPGPPLREVVVCLSCPPVVLLSDGLWGRRLTDHIRL